MGRKIGGTTGRGEALAMWCCGADGARQKILEQGKALQFEDRKNPALKIIE